MMDDGGKGPAAPARTVVEQPGNEQVELLRRRTHSTSTRAPQGAQRHVALLLGGHPVALKQLLATIERQKRT